MAPVGQPAMSGPRPASGAIPNHHRDEPLRVLTKLRYALFGVLAALAGVGVGHLVAAVTRPESSPVLAVGETVIDHTPTPVKNWAIAHFGTHDKTILVGSVLVGVLLLAGVAGVLAQRAFRYGAALLVLLVGVALYAALSRPVVRPVDAVPALATALVGVASLWLLVHLDHSRGSTDRTTADTAPTRRAVLLGIGERRRPRRRQRLRRSRDRPLPRGDRPHHPPPPEEPGEGVPRGTGPQGPRDHPVPHHRRRLLPRGHPALPAHRRGRLLGAGDRRRRRPRAEPVLRRPPGDAHDRARHHPDLRLERHRRTLRRRRALARRPPRRRSWTRPASGTAPTRSSRPTSTG